MVDALLAELQSDAPRPSDQLLARVLADAEAHQPAPSAQPQVDTGRWPEVRAWLNDLIPLPSLAGLVCAALTGVWIGISPPVALTDLADALNLGATDVYLQGIAPDYETVWTEG